MGEKGREEGSRFDCLLGWCGGGWEGKEDGRATEEEVHSNSEAQKVPTSPPRRQFLGLRFRVMEKSG